MTRLCFPRLVSWLADYMEHIKPFNFKGRTCPVCVIPPEALGCKNKRTHSTRDCLGYERLWLQTQDPDIHPLQQAVAARTLTTRGMRPMQNAFWGLPAVRPGNSTRPTFAWHLPRPLETSNGMARGIPEKPRALQVI